MAEHFSQCTQCCFLQCHSFVQFWPIEHILFVEMQVDVLGLLEVSSKTAEGLKYSLHNIFSSNRESSWEIIVSDSLGQGFKAEEKTLVIIRSSMLGVPTTNTGLDGAGKISKYAYTNIHS